jgi:hypothetical protein
VTALIADSQEFDAGMMGVQESRAKHDLSGRRAGSQGGKKWQIGRRRAAAAAATKIALPRCSVGVIVIY